MDGVERVFHVAGRTSLRPADREVVFAANLRGARVVFESALEAGVARVVHTSTAGAIGVAKPRGTADETTPFEIGHLGLAYVNSKHEAELEAFRLAAAGLPVVIVNPTFVLGPDDPTRTSMGLVRRFCLGQIPAYVDGALNIVDVRDVANGHLLADERGEVGERYILGGRNFTFDRLFADLARISGVAPPPLKLPDPRRGGRRRGGVRGLGCGRRARRPRSSRPPSGGPIATRRPAASSASSRARTRRRSRTPSAGSSSSSATGARAAALTATCCGRSVARSGCSADDHPLPLPDANQRALPLRGGRAPPAQARARARDRAGAVQALRQARDRGAHRRSAGCRCWSTATR